jgi:hypothetical protein
MIINFLLWRKTMTDTYMVWITQFCKPVTVHADTKEQAIKKVQEDTAWEVVTAEFEAEKLS